jgi:hypothetical protein
MTSSYLKNRLMIITVAAAVSLGLDYFHGDHIDVQHVLTKIFTMTSIVIVLSAVQYWWKSKRNA